MGVIGWVNVGVCVGVIGWVNVGVCVGVHVCVLMCACVCCKPIDEYPYRTEGAKRLGRRGWSPLPTGPPVLLPSAGSPHR